MAVISVMCSAIIQEKGTYENSVRVLLTVDTPTPPHLGPFGRISALASCHTVDSAAPHPKGAGQVGRARTYQHFVCYVCTCTTLHTQCCLLWSPVLHHNTLLHEHLSQ